MKTTRAKRKPTPAQLAARERFAQMARSGAFAKGRKRNPAGSGPVKMKIRGSETPDNPEGLIVTEAGALRWAKQNMPKDLKRAGFVPSVVAGARGWSINYGAAVPGHSTYSRNPTKKTVSQKISQLTREGYPQRQAVAIALNEERAGKVRRNPIVKDAVSKLPSNFKYGVQTKATENWSLQAAFKTKAEAVDYAQAIAKNYPRLPIRVVTYTGGPIPA